MRSRKSCGRAAGSIEDPYNNFGFKFETTLRARIASPRSVTTPTARPASTSTSRTGLDTRISTPRSTAALAMASVIAPMPPGALLAFAFAEHVRQQGVGGAGCIRTRIVADDAVETIRRLDRRTLEP